MGCGTQISAVSVTPKQTYSWIKGKILGVGTYGTVYEGLDNNTGSIVAIKNYKLTDNIAQSLQILKAVKKEVQLHRKLHHKNIVKYITTDVDPNRRFIDVILELVPGGSLLERIKAFGPQEEQLIRVYAQQILEGLIYLHSKGIVHRNLKCSNVLIDKDGTIKLTDFGTSFKLGGINSASGIGESPFWQAPEVVNNTGVSTLTDIWSFGCTLIELLASHPPYYRKNITVKEVYDEIKNKPPQIPERATFLLRDLISKCLIYDISHRPSAAMLLGHPFIRNSCASIPVVHTESVNLSVKTSNYFDTKNFPNRAEEVIVNGCTDSMVKKTEPKKEEIVKSAALESLEKKLKNL